MSNKFDWHDRSETLRLTNSDPVGHNCHGVGFNVEFNYNIASNKSEDYIPETAESSPAVLKCDMHSSVLVIRDDPYMTVSGADGTFNLPNIPAGTWNSQPSAPNVEYSQPDVEKMREKADEMYGEEE